MKTSTLIAIIVIVLVALGGYFLITSRATAPEAPTDETSVPADEDALAPAEGEEIIVTYRDGGFSPDTVTIKVGDTVRFANDSQSALWVGADEHPTHTEYDGTSTQEHCVDGEAVGGSFDMCHRGEPGETWAYTFTKAGTFHYHNHANASHGGTVVVE